MAGPVSIARRDVVARRSSLVVPGWSSRMIEKAAASEADEVVLDLEDSVSADRKLEARRTVCDALQAHAFRATSVTVRVNALDSPLCLRDVEALVATARTGRLDCLMLPKVDGPQQVHYLDRLLGALEREQASPAPVGLVLQLESARGVNAVHASAAAAAVRLEALAFGPGDYAADLGVPGVHIGALDADYPGHQWHWVMSEIANCARASGAQAIDGPCGDLHDAEGFRRSARLAVALGYDGKHCIHPAQVPWANEAFHPTELQIERARAIDDAVELAQREGRGAASFDGQMIDEASRRLAQRILARAELAAPRER